MSGAGKNVVGLRKSLGLTQQEFANRIGYSQTYLGDIEVGRTQPSRRFLESVRKAFGVSLDVILWSGINEWVEDISANPPFAEDDKLFFFVCAFADFELQDAEVDFLGKIEGKDHVVVDAKTVSTYNDLISEITGGDITGNKAPAALEEYCSKRGRFFIILKNLSRSKITKKGTCLSRIVKAAENLSVIVFDNPSFLEKYYEELWSHALPTLVSWKNPMICALGPTPDLVPNC